MARPWADAHMQKVPKNPTEISIPTVFHRTSLALSLTSLSLSAGTED